MHFGHLRPAVELLESFDLNELRLIPNHRPVHRGRPSATTAQRVDMLKIATQDLPALVVDPREAMRDKASYTYDTLCEFRAECPDASLVFFMGLDAFSEFDTWHRWQDILGLANLVVVERPDAQLSDWAAALIEAQSEKAGTQLTHANAGVIVRHSVTQLAISATDIRERIANRQSIDFLVPDRVKQYILSNALYHEAV